ncbi:MAG TPA: FeoC-like transcriptional regulator [Marmoricola sp.]
MSSSPLRDVLAAFDAGARSRTEIGELTGLGRDSVDAAIGHLVRMGRLEARELSTGCPGGGCGSCASGVDGAPGCGASAPGPRRSGPVLVQLTVRR